MHISLGRAIYEEDKAILASRDIAIQSVANGFAALVMEQRALGHRSLGNYGMHPPLGLGRCHITSMQALLLGRTIIGERIYDVSRGIDVLSRFPEVDTGRVACMGNSGGGTTTWYAACLEERIKAAMPSCFVCTYRGATFTLTHCQCNFIPHALEWFEMQDQACLIAPRSLVVVAGRHDDIFPIAPVQECYAGIADIYAKAGCPDNCRLVIGEGPHQFYPAEAWPVFNQLHQLM